MKLLKTVKRTALGLFLAATTICGGDIGYRMLIREGGEKLKANEIELCQTIFGDEIDYSKVRIVPHRFSMFQGREVIVTLGNEIYYDPEEKDNPEPISCFIHEMTHIWQNQNNIPHTGVRGALALWWHSKPHRYHSSYAYTPIENACFTDYNMEQQADIIEDYQDQVDQLRKLKNQPQIVDIETSESFYMKPVIDSTALKDFEDKTILDSIPTGYEAVKKPPPTKYSPEVIAKLEKSAAIDRKNAEKEKAVRSIVHAQFSTAACTWEELEQIKVKKQYRIKKKKPVTTAAVSPAPTGRFLGLYYAKKLAPK